MHASLESDQETLAAAESDEPLLHRVHRMLQIGGWEYVPATDTLRWTDEMYRLYELSPDHRPQLTTFVQFCAPEAQPALRQALTRAIERGAPCDLELPFMTAQGHPRWGRVLCEPHETDGRVTRLIGTLQDITERKETEEALADERDLLDRIMATSAMAIAVVDAAGLVVFANDRAAALLRGPGPTPDGASIEGTPYIPPGWTVETPNGNPALSDAHIHRRVIHDDAPVLDHTCALRRPDGERRIFSMSGAPLRDDAGHVVRVVLSIDDITERKAAERVLRDERAFLNALLDQMHAGVVVCDAAGRITLMNRTSKEWYGLPSEDASPDQWTQHCSLLRPDRTTPLPADEVPLYRALRGETVRGAEMVIAPEAGPRRIVECNGQPLHPDADTPRGAVVIMHDVTRRRELKDQLHHQAHHDKLTGLPNRKHFLKHCQRAIERHSETGTPYAVLFLDLDRFKSVNDSLGHHAGNTLLQAVAQRLQNTLRDGDFVARLSGDEFAVLLQPARDSDTVEGIAARIGDVLSTPFTVKGNTVHTTASIGVVLGSERHILPEDVLREADMAMYRAKLQSGGPLFFKPSLGEEIQTQFFLEADLYRALQRNELEVAYQPIVRLADGALAGFEALVRWQHPERGLLTPGAFIDVAQETGLITDIDRWIIRAACRQVHRWQEQFGHDAVPFLHTNCSHRTFLDASLSDYVSDVLAEAPIAPSRLALEITERELVEDMDRVVCEMKRFQSQNIRLCIDDFGVKYSSLGVLQQLPIDKIKVDRSFVQRIDGSGTRQEIVQTMADLADRMDLSLVAEGIETPPQLAALRQLGYPLGQGYLMARPLDAEAATACVAGEWPWRSHWTDGSPPPNEQAPRP